MYEVTRAKPVWQLRALIADGCSPRPLVIRVEPECVAMKPKGLRRWVRLPWKTVYTLAAMAEANAARRAKAASKRERRNVRRGRLA